MNDKIFSLLDEMIPLVDTKADAIIAILLFVMLVLLAKYLVKTHHLKH